MIIKRNHKFDDKSEPIDCKEDVENDFAVHPLSEREEA
jgi:hypothetical protein